jgi:hypothetical protein
MSENNIRQAFSIIRKKTAVLGTSHIMRKEQRSENCSLSGGVRHWFKGIITGLYSLRLEEMMMTTMKIKVKK